MVSRLLNGVDFNLYTAAAGTAALTVAATDGAIATTGYDLFGQGNFQNGVEWDQVDEFSELMFQGGKGLADEERRTVQGLMMTVGVYDHTPQTAEHVWGTTVADTPAGAGQVGVYKQSLVLPLVRPSRAVEMIIGSPFDTDGSEGWLAHIYLPKASIRKAAWSFDVDAEGSVTAYTIRQLNHSTDAFWEVVYADAT